MSEIALRNVCKQFDSEHYGVKDFNLDIHDKEFVIFVGPSGCGKSTTLRIIAGLEEITDGELWIDGELSNYLEPKERGMSMVFQNYALYPNMTVYGNMAYALKIRKLPKDEIDRKVHEVAKILEIEQLLEKEKQAEETRNSELPLEVQLSGSRKPFSWMSPFPTWMQSSVLRCVWSL